jgi:hypothetical protein
MRVRARIEIDLSFLDSLADIGPMIEARVSEAMAAVDVNLQEGLRYIDGDRIRVHIERAAEKAEQAAERIAERARAAAEREAEHARRHAEREAERARLRAEHAERRWQRASGYHGPTPPTAAHTPPHRRLHPRPAKTTSGKSACKCSAWWNRASSRPKKRPTCSPRAVT